MALDLQMNSKTDLAVYKNQLLPRGVWLAMLVWKAWQVPLPLIISFSDGHKITVTTTVILKGINFFRDRHKITIAKTFVLKHIIVLVSVIKFYCLLPSY